MSTVYRFRRYKESSVFCAISFSAPTP